MKKRIFIAAFTVFTALAARSQSADELAVRQACEAETRAWLASDAETFNSLWQIRPYSRILVTTEDGQTISIGSDQLKPAKPGDPMGGKGGTFANSNYQIHIDCNLAWASYDELTTDAKGVQHPSQEFRMLERVDGNWKLVGMSVHQYKMK